MLKAIKHEDATDGELQSPNLSLALTSLAGIETCLASTSVPLTRREAAVCARILYGMSSAGIALDLELGEETVMTYRKRAYFRLGFTTQRELLLWYLNLWGTLNLQGHSVVPRTLNSAAAA